LRASWAHSVFPPLHVLVLDDSTKIVSLRLFLLRHAKSDWPDNLGDHERPLTQRGRDVAPRMGMFMHKRGYVPAKILCSTAARTRETLDLLLGTLGDDIDVAYERALYLPAWQVLLANVQAAAATPLLLIGHNPGMEELASALAATPQNDAERMRLKKLRNKFPTAALAVLDFDVAQWSAIRAGTGTLIDFIRPRDIGASVIGTGDDD